MVSLPLHVAACHTTAETWTEVTHHTVRVYSPRLCTDDTTITPLSKSCSSRTHLCCLMSVSQRNQWKVTLVFRLTNNWININSSLCPWKTKKTTDYAANQESTCGCCQEPLCSVPTCIIRSWRVPVQLGFPPRWIISIPAHSEKAARSPCVPQPQVQPLGASNMSWEFLAVWHSVTWCRDILSSHSLSKEISCG